MTSENKVTQIEVQCKENAMIPCLVLFRVKQSCAFTITLRWCDKNQWNMTQIQVNNPHKRMEARGTFQNNPVFITILSSQVEQL